MHLDYIIGNEDTDFGGLLRSYIDEPVADASDWTDIELLGYVNAEHRHLFSVVRGFNEDWFGRSVVFPLVENQLEYYLPLDCVNPRRIELIRAAAVTGTAPNYIVDESAAGPQEVNEIQLAGKDNIKNYITNRNILFNTGYYLFDDRINFEPNQQIGSTLYGRIYYLPQAPDLHRGVAQAGGASTITLALNGAATTLGIVRNIDNYYKGMRVEIISGVGAGQLRIITKNDGATGIATIHTPWATTPDSTSVYSIVSPIQEDFHELLALGAALRAKGIKVEDDVSGIGTIYTALRSDMDNVLDQRNQQFNRRVNQTTRRAAWF